jgi:hypothetical protein
MKKTNNQRTCLRKARNNKDSNNVVKVTRTISSVWCVENDHVASTTTCAVLLISSHQATRIISALEAEPDPPLVGVSHTRSATSLHSVHSRLNKKPTIMAPKSELKYIMQKFLCRKYVSIWNFFKSITPSSYFQHLFLILLIVACQFSVWLLELVLWFLCPKLIRQEFLYR